MRTIWKYRLGVPETETKVEVGPGFDVRTVRMQDGDPFIWIEHDPDLEPTTVRFTIYGTGHPIAPGLRWVGTFFDDPFVWHVYQGDPLYQSENDGDQP